MKKGKPSDRKPRGQTVTVSKAKASGMPAGKPARTRAARKV